MVCIPQSSRARETADRRFAVGLRSRDRGFEVQVPGYRYYNPNLGRWVSRDPIGERGGAGLFCFVSNEPISGLDPLGLRRVPCVFLGLWRDTGWRRGFAGPDGTFVNAGGSGATVYGISTGAFLYYFRRIVYRYHCACLCPPNMIPHFRVMVYGERRGPVPFGRRRRRPVLWQLTLPPNLWSMWPPTDPGSWIFYFTGGQIPAEPQSGWDEAQIQAAFRRNRPSLTTVGVRLKDTGAPSRVCLWP